MLVQDLDREELLRLLDFSMKNLSNRALPVVYNSKLVMLELNLGKALLEFYRSLINVGAEIYQEHFGTIQKKIIELKRLALDSGRCMALPLEEDIEDPSEELVDIFKRYCMSNHPDISPKNETSFREMKHLYDEGKFFDFLDNCDSEIAGVLYLKWVHLQKELDTIKAKIEVKLALTKGKDPLQYSKLISAEWKLQRKKLAEVIQLLNNG